MREREGERERDRERERENDLELAEFHHLDSRPEIGIIKIMFRTFTSEKAHDCVRVSFSSCYNYYNN